ncbi:MAG: hypothetical protein K2N51_20915 [Lachnospiraceae bacterium]|nr:hypothetical protein [Lachnospiraceae bacterium]
MGQKIQIADKPTLDTILSKMEQLETKVSSISSTVSSLQTSNTSLATKISSLESSNSALNTNVNSISTKVDTLESKLSTLTTNVSNLSYSFIDELSLTGIQFFSQTVSGQDSKTLLDFWGRGIVYLTTTGGTFTMTLDGLNVNVGYFNIATNQYRIPFTSSIKIVVSGGGVSGSRKTDAIIRYVK